MTIATLLFINHQLYGISHLTLSPVTNEIISNIILSKIQNFRGLLDLGILAGRAMHVQQFLSVVQVRGRLMVCSFSLIYINMASAWEFSEGPPILCVYKIIADTTKYYTPTCTCPSFLILSSSSFLYAPTYTYM